MGGQADRMCWRPERAGQEATERRDRRQGSSRGREGQRDGARNNVSPVWGKEMEKEPDSRGREKKRQERETAETHLDCRGGGWAQQDRAPVLVWSPDGAREARGSGSRSGGGSASHDLGPQKDLVGWRWWGALLLRCSLPSSSEPPWRLPHYPDCPRPAPLLLAGLGELTCGSPAGAAWRPECPLPAS